MKSTFLWKTSTLEIYFFPLFPVFFFWGTLFYKEKTLYEKLQRLKYTFSPFSCFFFFEGLYFTIKVYMKNFNAWNILFPLFPAFFFFWGGGLYFTKKKLYMKNFNAWNILFPLFPVFFFFFWGTLFYNKSLYEKLQRLKYTFSPFSCFFFLGGGGLYFTKKNFIWKISTFEIYLLQVILLQRGIKCIIHNS